MHDTRRFVGKQARQGASSIQHSKTQCVANIGVEVMSLVSTPLSQAASHASWWSKITNLAKPEGKEEEPSYIDAEDFSDHLLRDIGIFDGRALRGERQETNDLSVLFRDYQKRSL
jgi:hypothetical protein